VSHLGNISLDGILNSNISTTGDNSKNGKVEEALKQGISSHQSGRLDEAIQWYQKVLKIQPGHTDSLSNLGCALLILGELLIGK
jgi:Flp pilus assembly protein TadD